jgi:hypothetical protein
MSHGHRMLRIAMPVTLGSAVLSESSLLHPGPIRHYVIA